MHNLVKIVDNVRVKQPTEIDYPSLYETLLRKYSRENTSGCTCYEYFDSTNQMVKPHVDYEEVLDKFDKLATHEREQRMLVVLKDLLNIEKDEWAIADDSRLFLTDKKKTKFKVSLHFVCFTRKCELMKFGAFIKKNMSVFIKNRLPGVDPNIYRNGINKFRLPMTKKKASDLESLLTPHNHDSFATFHRHLVQIIDDCKEIELPEVSVLEEYKPSEIMQQRIDQTTSNHQAEIKSILEQYTTISEKQGTDKFEGCVFYDIQEKLCGQNHRNNHNYLIHNKNTNTLKVKCFSLRCESFERTLYLPPPPTQHFKVSYFQSIPIPSDETDNYREVKKYFEQFFIYIRDNNSYYRIRYEFNQKYKYFEKEIKAIQIAGFKDLVYKKIGADDKIETATFLSKYQNDPYKSAYLGLSFSPFGSHTQKLLISNGDYNLFTGFGFHHLLTYNEKMNIPAQKHNDFNWFLGYIKKYVCGLDHARKLNDEKAIQLAEHSFNYLMYYLANIIQNPTVCPQIILCLYSNVHGTGKSGLCKFLSNMYGGSLCYFGSYDQIMEKHTTAHVGKLLNVIEESDRKTSRKYHSMMKDYSQREVAVYNEKNKPQCHIKTFVRYIQTTNDKDGIFFTSEDRRHVVYTFHKMSDKSRVKRLLSIEQDPYIMYLFGLYLTEKVKIPYVKLNDWEKERPLTPDYYSMRAEDPVTQFFKSFLRMEGVSLEHLPDNEYLIDENKNTIVSVAKESFYQLFVLFFNENNCLNRKYKSKLQFVKHISINLKKEIRVVKYKSINRKDYYRMDLVSLWSKYYEGEKFVNHHIGELDEDSEVI